MKIIKYQAKITNASDGYSVEFPDLLGCFSSGASLKEALGNAREALDLYLEEARDPNWKVPLAKERKGKNYYWINPSPEIAIPLTIRELRQRKGKTQPQTAKLLNMTVQQYQKMEYPKKSNPTTKSLMLVADKLGYEIEFKESVSA
jgi:predicted RNase H-like HicB family nuclease